MLTAQILLAAQLLLYTSLSETALPTEYSGARWGMSVEELNELNKVYKASQHGNYNYADHSEVNPDVYVRKTTDHKRIEYYFFDKKLYKIYVVYPKGWTSRKNYQKLLTKFTKRYGLPDDTYQETYFGLQVQHNKWDDERTTLDLRLGAGFIYEVRVEKQAAKKKATRQERKKSI